MEILYNYPLAFEVLIGGIMVIATLKFINYVFKIFPEIL